METGTGQACILQKIKTHAMKKNIIYLLVFFIVSQNLSCTKESAGKAFNSNTGKGGSLARFTVVGNYLYTVDKTQLKAFNVADPSLPELKSTIDVGFEIETIFPFRDRLFIGSTSVVHIFSIENPEQPKKLSEAISPEVLRRCDPVVVKDSVAYATLRTNGPCGGARSVLAVYDIRDVLHPVSVNQVPVNEPYGLGYAGDALYVCDRFTLIVFNISDPYVPVLKNQLDGHEFYDVIAEGNTLICWIKDGVALYDITDRLNPEPITTIN
jgi:hypothetical protein